MNELTEGEDSPLLTGPEREMLACARNLTLDPASSTEDDVARLRQAGFSDRAILEINLAVAYMNFVNRIAEGLGVELERSMHSFTR